MKRLILNQDSLFFTIICKMEGLFDLTDDNEDMPLYRRTIFECLSLLNSLFIYNEKNSSLSPTNPTFFPYLIVTKSLNKFNISPSSYYNKKNEVINNYFSFFIINYYFLTFLRISKASGESVSSFTILNINLRSSI